MTRAKDEEKVLEDIFGSKVTIKNLRLGDLIYLKDSLDKRVRDERYLKISCIADFNFTSRNFRTAIREGLKEGYNWRKIIDESVIIDMYPEQALYLDCLARLNEIQKEICESELDNIIK